MNAKLKSFCNQKLKNPEHHNELGIDICLSPFTILVGPNGTGKTLSLLKMEYECKQNNIKCVKYSNKHEDIVQKAGLDWDPYKLLCAFHSEGERINDSFNNWCETVLAKELVNNEDNIYILLDELDSGLSVDRIESLVMSLYYVIEHEHKVHPKRMINFVITCNSYEMLDCFYKHATLCMQTVVYFVPTRELVSYNSYKKFIKPFRDYMLYMTKDEI